MATRGITFDVGGTLDGPGIAWRPRFFEIYRELEPSFRGAENEARLERAFFDADDNLAARHALSGLGLAETVRRQVGDTLAALGRSSETLASGVAGRFVEDARASLSLARPLLIRLRREFRLGVVSNFYGNLKDVLKGEDLLDIFQVVIDSDEVGVKKPDPGIFRAACEGLALEPREVVHVGDSYSRDVEGALGAGLGAVWLAPGQPARGEERGVVRIERLADLESALERAFPS